MADLNLDEKSIVEQVVQGDRDKYRLLVDRYSPMVFHIVRNFVNDEQTVEELAQQIFVKTYEKLSSFNYKSKFSSWLYMIAKNHCRDYVKDIRRENKPFSEMETHELEAQMPQSESADRPAMEEEWSRLLNEALQHIKQEHAEAFLMKYRNDMSYKAMSERLGTSVSALKVRVHRARKELKAFIEQNS